MKTPWSWLRTRLALAALVAAAWSCVDGVSTEVAPPPPDIPLLFALEASSRLSTDEEEALNDAFDRVDRIQVRLFRPGESEPFIDTVVTVVPGQDAYELDIAVPGEEAGSVVDVEVIGASGQVELFGAVVGVRVKETKAGSTGGDDTVVSLPVRYIGPGLSGTILDPDGTPAPGVTVELRRAGTLVQSTETSIDGEYLFTDLEPGSYTVQAVLSAGLVSCPAAREVGPLVEDSKVVGGFKLSRTGCELRILVLSGGDVDDNGSVIGGLSAEIPEGRFSSAFVVVSAPSLSSLLAYDAVVLYENGSFDHATRVGNRMAEYVAAGGNLVIGSFYWQNRSDGGYGHPGWGALEAIDPFTSSGGANYLPGTVTSISPHPITEGVAPFTVAQWWGGAVSKGGTTVVASWHEGSPLAGYTIGASGQRIVAISTFPGLMGSADGQLRRLWGNAVRWAAAAGGPTSGSRLGLKGR